MDFNALNQTQEQLVLQQQQDAEQFTAVNIDEIAEIGDLVPVGTYECRITAVNPKLSKSNKPMIEANFEIVSGEQSGMEIKLFYSLVVTRSPRNGKVYANGIMALKKALAAVGKTLPQGFNFPTDMNQAGKIFAERMHPNVTPRVIIQGKEEVRRVKNPTTNAYEPEIDAATGKPKTSVRFEIVGTPGGQTQQASGAAASPLSGIV